MNTFITTVSDRRVDVLAPDWNDIDLGDLARGLSQLRRFGGQSRRGFSVGQHSLVVAELAHPAVRLAALLHDAHEAYLGDWTGPGIEALCTLDGFARNALMRLRRGLDIAIARRVLEDAQARPRHGTAIEATVLADEMAGPVVGRADDEALALEMAIKGQHALQNGPSPAVPRAVDLYGVMEPAAAEIALEWAQAVRAAARERYGVEP